MMAALLQKKHTPACTIRQGLNDGYEPSIRILDLGTGLCGYFNKKDVKTIHSLALLSINDTRAVLSGRKYPEKDIARIQTALAKVGLKLGMTRNEFKNYKKASQS